jgi:hypothetical protein
MWLGPCPHFNDSPDRELFPISLQFNFDYQDFQSLQVFKAIENLP